MALVLTPEAPVTEWLVSLDAEIARASMFFVERPVVLDAGLLTDGDETGLIEALAERGIRVIAAENAAPTLTGLPAPLAGGRSTGDLEVPDPSADAPPPPPPPRALLVEQTVRSGQQVVHPEGDVTIIGGVASGAEVMAGGSIHVYGALRGRAVAGFGGHRGARILCRKLHAELLAIDGFYMTADDMDAGLVGTPVMVQLDGEHLTITGME
jgi:septum site-determining protein MinC